MNVEKVTSSLFISLLVSVSVYFFSADLVAMNSDVRTSTYTEVLTSQPSPKLLEDWMVNVWRGTPECEIVKEHKGMVLKIRSHQSHMALYKKVQVDLALHPHFAWKWKMTELPVQVTRAWANEMHKPMVSVSQTKG